MSLKAPNTGDVTHQYIKPKNRRERMFVFPTTQFKVWAINVKRARRLFKKANKELYRESIKLKEVPIKVTRGSNGIGQETTKHSSG